MPRRVLEAVALEGDRAAKLSRGQVSALLGLSFDQTEEFLSRHQAYLHYSLEDLDADRAILNRILAAK